MADLLLLGLIALFSDAFLYLCLGMFILLLIAAVALCCFAVYALFIGEWKASASTLFIALLIFGAVWGVISDLSDDD